MNIALWIIQALLALLFLAGGLRKVTSSPDALAKSLPALATLPMPFVRFIGIAELLASFGLILPSVTKVAPGLTPAAAGGLVILMLCASVFHATRREYSHIGLTGCILLLATFILVGRLALAPIVG